MRKISCFIFSFILLCSCFILSAYATDSNNKAYQDGNTIVLTWDKYASAIKYEIIYTNLNNSNDSGMIETENTNYVLENLVFKTTYRITINAIYTSWKTDVLKDVDVYMDNVAPKLESNSNGVITVKSYIGMEYSLDGDFYSSNNYFSNLTTRMYTITQRDRQGNISKTLEIKPDFGGNPFIDTQRPNTPGQESEQVVVTSANTKTTVYGVDISLTNATGNFDASYKLNAKDVTSVLYSEDRSTFNGYVKKMKKELGDTYGDVLAIYDIEYGRVVNGEFSRQEIMYNSMLSVSVKKFDIEKAYFVAIYKDKVTSCATKVKDGNAVTVVSFDPDFAYIALIADKDALSKSSYKPTYTSAQVDPSGKTPSAPSIEINISPTLIIAGIIVLVFATAAAIFAIMFIKKVKVNKSRDWLNDNR